MRAGGEAQGLKGTEPGWGDPNKLGSGKAS